MLAVGSAVDAAPPCLRPQGDTSGAAGAQVFAAVFNPLEASVFVFSEHLNGGSEGFVLWKKVSLGKGYRSYSRRRHGLSRTFSDF